MRAVSPENVTDLIAKPPEIYDPEPRHVSKYLNKIIRAEKRGKSAHKTFGVPSVDLDSPLEYLKKGTGIVPKRSEVHHKHYQRPDYPRKLPEWQPIRPSERGRQISERRLDFMKRNVDEAKNRRPTEPRMYYVDDRHGNAHPLKTSGMYPVYINRKDYGEVPSYITPLDQQGNRRQKTASFSRGKDKSKRRSRQEKRGPQREDKVRRDPRQKTVSPRKGEELRKNVLQKSSVKREDKLRGGSCHEYTSPQAKDESKEQQSGDKENGNKSEGVMSERKSLEGDDNGKESESRESVGCTENEDKESTTSIPGDYKQPRCRYVTEDERAELLYGMKKKWDEMMKKFQCLPFLTDTQPKAKRKEGMEKDLLQLEKDIEIIESHPYIYVYSDNEAD